MCFKKFDWVCTESWVNHLTKEVEGRYRVRRKYFMGLLPLYYTNQDYFIFKYRWDYFKKKLSENKNFHYVNTSYACTEHKRDTRKKLITRKEWGKLKKGSILQSKNGKQRTVKNVVNQRYVVFNKVGSSTAETAYLYSDLCYKYKLVKL